MKRFRYLVVLSGVRVALALCLFLSISKSLAEDFTLVPSSFSKPVEQGVTILFSAPNGWKEDRNPDSEYAGSNSAKLFRYSANTSPYPPYIVVSCEVPSSFSSTGPTADDPRNSHAAMWLDTSAQISNYKKLEVFDAGPNGKLPVWLIRSKGNDCCLTVLIVHGPVRAEISVLMEDEDHLQYIDALKQFARSVRFALIAGRVRTEREAVIANP